jgi:translation initiation factor IF-2
MNNGKVRIYELSKELHLENKDILEICDQLNITVKSHSSTITETEAENIKAAAEKYTHRHPEISVKSAESRSGETQTEAKIMAKPFEDGKDNRKQQILALHKQNRTASSPNNKLAKKSLSPMLLNPPRPLADPEVALTVLDQGQEGVLGDLQSSPIPQEGEKPQDQDKENNISQPKAEKSRLFQPPILQKPEIKNRGEQQPTSKPQRRTEGKSAEEKNRESSEHREPKRGLPQRPERLSAERLAAKKLEEKFAPKLHQKPQRPKSVEEDVSELDLEGADVLVATEGEEVEGDNLLDDSKRPKQKPKRPTLAPVGKRNWEEEEEEDAKAKAAKAPTKNKRRSIVIEEDDEDLHAVLDALAGQTVASFSIARPPKANKPVTSQPIVTEVPKAKKPTPKTERAAKQDKRERNQTPEPAETIIINGNLTIRDLADLMQVPDTEIIKHLFFKGIAVNITQTLEEATARQVAEEMGVTVETTTKTAAATKTTEMIEVGDLENLQLRPPVVTIMGHVDHGKTTLLDSIRKTKVAQGEAGGITQHIGAYHVDVEHQGKKQQIVFLDTPGHEAFTAMRARGTRVTDIAILVVAADDGVQPQTREAISHAKAAGVPIVVAINKIDKPDANPDRVKQELADLGLLAEDWGGETIMVPVSALKGENLDALLEMILLVAEIGELSANPDRAARGTVIEAHLDRARGPVASLLVQNGTLRVGDVILVGSVFGKIRAMIDDRGDKVEAATPSFAVEILGLNEVPAAGDEFEVFPGEKEARLIAEQRAEEKRQSRLQMAMSSRRISLSTLSEKAREGELKELNLILKADVQGSVEAIIGSLQQLPQREVQIRILLAAPGEITETDVDLAAASGAVIVGFNTTLASGARSAADREGVDIREYNIIYKLLDDIQAAMEGLLDPEEIEETLGTVEVRAVFAVGRGAVAGCYVLSGKVVRNRPIRVRRNGQVIYEGNLDSLRRVKEDAREVSAGYECGIAVNKFNDWKEGDIIESYEMALKRRTLSAN